MKKEINALYDEVIREHNRHPVNFEPMEDADDLLVANNPLCGDRFTLYLKTSAGKITQFSFSGMGCALSKSSTSVMISIMQNKSIEEARVLCDEFLSFIEEGRDTNQYLFKAFEAVNQFPSRKDCVKLSWDKMREFLQTY